MLGPLGEETLRQTLLISDGSFGIFLESPTSVALIGVMAFLVFVPLLAPYVRRQVRARLDAIGRQRRQRRQTEESPERDRTTV